MFHSKGFCKRGMKCMNYHSGVDKETDPAKVGEQICVHFSRGMCRYGDACQKKHDPNTISDIPPM